jgi:hypothetical protein
MQPNAEPARPERTDDGPAAQMRLEVAETKRLIQLRTLRGAHDGRTEPDAPGVSGCSTR